MSQIRAPSSSPSSPSRPRADSDDDEDHHHARVAPAVMVHVLVTALIVFSALIAILETVPTFHSLPGGIWFGLETSLVALFTVEYVAPCVAMSYSWSAFFA